MALATRPKPKAHHKKRQAQHHRHSKHYMKAYFPYLPMLGIVGLGALVNQAWSSSNAAMANLKPDLATTRLGLVTGNSSTGLLYAVLAVTFAAFAVFVLAHWYRIHKMLNRGQKFALNHPWLDSSLVFIVTAGVVLTRF